MKAISKLLEVAQKRIPATYKPNRQPYKFDNIVVMLSGGVDSAVAASIFAQKYPKTKAVYMQNWSKSQSLTNPREEPCYEQDWKSAVNVAKYMGIPIEKVNFESDYWIDVFEPMLEGYKEGITPNPDIGCNRFIKFGKLVDYLDGIYGEKNYWLVSGHYTSILQDRITDQWHLNRAYHKQKDQSYYLSQVSNKVLPQLQLPMGQLLKPEVRKVAEEMNLPNAFKPDSQGICFVSNSQTGQFKHFLKHYLNNKEGDIVTLEEDHISGTIIKKRWGKHEGLWSYTIGQKVGFSMPQGNPKYKGTWFVSKKLKDSNELIIVKGYDNPSFFKDQLQVINFKYLSKLSPQQLKNECAKGNLNIQYRSLQEPVQVLSIEIDEENNSLKFKLSSKQRAMAPGQYCCLYWHDTVIGSGPIKEAF